MGDQFRSKVEQYSPKSSPRGARSPVVSRQDSTGTLKTTISLGKNPSIVHSGPFYLMKEPPGNERIISMKLEQRSQLIANYVQLDLLQRLKKNKETSSCACRDKCAVGSFRGK